MKKPVALLIAFMLLIETVPSFAEDTITLYILGEKINNTAIMVHNSTYLPVRAVSEFLGIDVLWDDETKSVILGITPVDCYKGNGINVYFDGLKIDVEPIIIDNRTYLPARKLCDAIGMEIDWRAEERAAIITCPIGIDNYNAVRESAGYLSLTPHVRERFRSLLLPVYSEHLILLSHRFNCEEYLLKSPMEQSAEIERFLSTPILNLFDGGPPNIQASYEITSKEYIPSYDFWRGNFQPAWIYSISMDGSETEKHQWTIISSKEDEELINTIANAAGRLPYPLRKYFVKFIYDPTSNINYHGSDGSFRWRDANLTLNEEIVRRALYNVCSAYIFDSTAIGKDTDWSSFMEEDIVKFSDVDYYMQDLVAYGRLFLGAHYGGFADTIEKLSPNRFKYFAAMLYETDNEYFSDYKTHYDKVVDEISFDKLHGAS